MGAWEEVYLEGVIMSKLCTNLMFQSHFYHTPLYYDHSMYYFFSKLSCSLAVILSLIALELI